MSNSELETTIREVIREINLSSLEERAKERLLDRLRAVRPLDGPVDPGSSPLQVAGSAERPGPPPTGPAAPPPGPAAPPPGPGGLPLVGHGTVSGSDYWLFRLVVLFL